MGDDQKQADSSFVLAVIKTFGLVVLAITAVPAAAMGTYCLVFACVLLTGSYGHGDVGVPFLAALPCGAVAGLAAIYGVTRLFRRS